MGLQGVGEVVQIPNVLAVELDQDIARFETGFRGGCSIPHIGESNAMWGLIEVGDAAEVGAVAATTTGAPRRSFRLSYSLELGPLGIVRQTCRDLRDVTQKLGCIRRVDLVPGVAGLMIIAVQAAEEK